MIYVDGNLVRTNWKQHTPTTPVPQSKWHKAQQQAETAGYAAGMAYTTKALWMPMAGTLIGGLTGGLPGAEAGFETGLRWGLA